MSSPYETHFNYLRQQQSLQYPTEDIMATTYNTHTIPAITSLPPIGHEIPWIQSHPGLLDSDNTGHSWMSMRSNPQTNTAESTEYDSAYDFSIHPSRYPPFGSHTESPSRNVQYSIASASSRLSPVPVPASVSYDYMPDAHEDSSYLPSQPMVPEQVVYSVDQTTPDPASPASSVRKLIHCRICLKSFDRRSNFKSHWETHDQNRERIPCSQEGCTKTFGRPAEMTRHVNSHHGARSFTCDACHREFTRHDILIRHRNSKACPTSNSPREKKRRGKIRESRD